MIVTGGDDGYRKSLGCASGKLLATLEGHKNFD